MDKRIRHALENVGVRFLIGCASLLPQRLLYPYGAALGWLAFSVFRIRRSVSLDNIRRALEVDDQEALNIGRNAYMNLGRSVVEFAAFKRFSKESLFHMVSIEGAEYFDEALQAGRGAVLFTGHFGSWELLAARVAQSGYPFHVLVGEQSNKRVDELINNLRRFQNIQVISYKAGLRHALRVLSKNAFVAILADQDARRGGIFVDFLGQPASTFRGPARLAIQRSCPVISGFIVRQGDGRHAAVILKPIWPDNSLQDEEALRDLTQRYTAQLESFVRKYPDQYFWAHRRWKTQP
ncbi:MAG: hypothetical protein GTO51_03945 [Candidatus Latescibacteria bacterium]|nr:hypothetical protein [Candidatus Latescibacterota bacterium]NIM20992.1 hypothetical protein [Candidatus Latescibacterota bacterium]NIM65127.1 hypothetical protein [Candidatus Latescibacterota bacterium]NIO01642.1 hypothetical protein [Candidatus Latescibacterota bacterium]NIO28159.1 hypothetical protein [Candidatus Latescibacterota bacterium]